MPVVHLGFPSGNARLGRCRAASPRSRGWCVTCAGSDPTSCTRSLFHSYVTAAPAARLARVQVLVAGRRSLGDFKRGRRVLLAFERIATSVTDLLVANAEAVAEDTIRNEKVRADKITTVYNGLPDSAFEPAAPAELVTEAPIVLCVANLKIYKGHRFLLDAVAMLRDRDLPCTLALVGDGPERRALEDQAAQLKIDVRFLGTRTDVESLLARAYVVVLPSLHEGMSNAVMEAMAAGLPDRGHRGRRHPRAAARPRRPGSALRLRSAGRRARTGARRSGAGGAPGRRGAGVEPRPSPCRRDGRQARHHLSRAAGAPMCGIAGIVSASPPDAGLVRRMCDAMIHRGPDGAGFHDDEHAALGMRRLAIIDVAGGDQPVYNEDRTVAAVFNGELYNFAELRETLRERGHRFTTRR